MGRNIGSVKPDLLLQLTAGNINDQESKEKLRLLDDKVQRMLLWSTLCAVWSYLFLIVTIGRIYAGFNGKHTTLLMGSMFLLYVFMGWLIYLVWKGLKYNRSYFHYASRSYLNYQLEKLTGQRKLIGCYLLEYGLLLAMACTFFYLDLDHGLPGLLRLTAPVTLLTFGCGSYFIASFTKQIRELKFLHQKINVLHTAHLHLN